MQTLTLPVGKGGGRDGGEGEEGEGGGGRVIVASCHQLFPQLSYQLVLAVQLLPQAACNATV